MKILQIVPYYSPAWAYGGPPRVMFDLARSLVHRGHEVTVFTTDAFEKDKRVSISRNSQDGVKVFYFKNVSNYLAWHKKKFFPIGFRSFLEENICNFELVHISGIRNYLNMVAYPLIKRSGVPYVIDAHGALPVASTGLKTIARVYDSRFVRPMLREASSLFAQTEHEAESFRLLGGSEEKIRLMPLAIDMHSYLDLPGKGDFRRKFGIGDEEKVITFLGRISRDKGVSLLINIFSQVSKGKEGLKLLIIGRDDGYLKEAKKLTSRLSLGQKVIFVGPLYGKEKNSAYLDSDLFLYTPIYWEETSVATLEAMACYTPVVVTKQADIPWLEEYRAGYPVLSNINEIVAKVTELIESEEQLKVKSINAFKLIEEKYDLAKRVDEIETVFRQIVYGKVDTNV